MWIWSFWPGCRNMNKLILLGALGFAILGFTSILPGQSGPDLAELKWLAGD